MICPAVHRCGLWRPRRREVKERKIILGVVLVLHLNLTVRVNPTKQESQRAKQERYYLE